MDEKNSRSDAIISETKSLQSFEKSRPQSANNKQTKNQQGKMTTTMSHSGSRIQMNNQTTITACRELHGLPSDSSPSSERPSTSAASPAVTTRVATSQQAHIPEENNQHNHYRGENRRLQFALFLKILLNVLLRAGETDLYHQVKKAVHDSIERHNRMQDPSFEPMVELLEAHLWLIVGDKFWNEAIGLRRTYWLKRHHP